MTLDGELIADRDIALEFAESLERELGDASLLTVGLQCESIAEVLDEEGLVVISQRFATRTGIEGLVAFVAVGPFAEMLERVARDELVLTACRAALENVRQMIGTFIGSAVETERAGMVDLQSVAEAAGEGEIAVFPILDATEPVACLVIVARVAQAASPTPTGSLSPAAAERGRAGVDLHPTTSVALSDVRMAVTAELGRCRMTVRELLSIGPGAVLDLDRAVGTPVDVLVNGTVVARGEVVVIEEEFGVRISEILECELSLP